MKKFLLFVMMCVCVSVGTWAATVTDLYNDQSQVVGTLTVDGNSAVLNFTVQNGSLRYNDKQLLNDLTEVKVTGYYPGDIFNVNQWTAGLHSCQRMDLSGITDFPSNFSIQNNTSVTSLILPNTASFANVQTNTAVKYLIKANTGDTQDNAVKVWVKNDSENNWVNDPYVQDANYIKAYNSSTEDDNNYLTGEAVSLLQTTKWVNGDGKEYTPEPFECDADTEDEEAQLAVHLADHTITSCKIKGTLSNLSLLKGIKVETLDLSGVNNSDLTGLSLPVISNTSEDIKLPKGITYSSSGDIVIESTSSATLADIKNVVFSLKDAGLDPVSIEFPGGSSVTSSGVLTIDPSAANDIQIICEIISFAGIPVNSITFPDGSALSSGTLSIANSTTDKDKQKELLKACKELGCIPTTVNFPNNASTCVNGTLTPESNDKIADLCEVLSYGDVIIETINFVGANAASYHNGVITFTDASDEANLQTYKEILENANLPVNGVVFSTGTKLIAGKLTVESSDDNVTDLTAKVGALKGNGFTINSAQLPGNIYWNKDGSVASPNGTDNDALKTRLETAGLTPVNLPASEVEVYGSHVTVVNGVTIITTTSMNELPHFTQEEIDKIKVATNLKLVGPFSNSDDFTNYLKGWCKPTNLDLSEAILESSFQIPGDWRSTIEALTLPTSPDYTVIPTGFFTDATNLKSISIPANIEEVAKGAFLNSKSLEAIDFAEDGNLRIIGESAFQQTGIKGQLVIPNSVRRIEASAFKQCTEITSLVINKDSELEYIGKFAFVMDQGPDDIKLKNIYVYAEKEIECDGYAWDFYMTDGQTDMATVTTRLHYPPSMYYWYVGDWKSEVNGGRIEGHDDLLRLRNSVDAGVSSYTYKDPDTEQEITKYVTVTPKPSIGWQKFVSSGIPVTAEFEWRSYSDITHIKVPALLNEAGQKIADVYIVTDYNAPEGENDAQAVLYQMKPGDIIPAGTGIILHHNVTKEGGALLVFPHVTDEEVRVAEEADPNAMKPYRYVIEGDSRAVKNEEFPTYTGIETHDYKRGGTGDAKHNYLEAINCTVPRAIYNAENDNIVDWETLLMAKGKNTVTYRNYFFGNGKKLWDTYQERLKANNNDEEKANTIGRNTLIGDNFGVSDRVRRWGFFRCISDYYAISTKAFLHLPGTIYKNPDNTSMDATQVNLQDQTLSVTAKEMGMIVIGLDDAMLTENGIATGVVELESQVQHQKIDGSYYTLQGVKVSTPARNGIYIHNGKKVVVK